MKMGAEVQAGFMCRRRPPFEVRGWSKSHAWTGIVDGGESWESQVLLIFQSLAFKQAVQNK